MNSKIHTVIISSILAFALIAGIPAAFVSVLAQGEGGDTGGMPGGEGMTGGDMAGGNMTGGMGGEGMTGGDMAGGMGGEGMTDGDGNGDGNGDGGG
jgi:hypothetical protein